MRSCSIEALCISILFGCGLCLQPPADGTQEAELLASGQPMMINLRRDSVPVKRQGRVVSFKTTYSGLIGVGGPVPQMFRMVFDTGSGHVVIPAAGCRSEACLVHQRFNTSASQSAVAVNANGSPVPHYELCDQVDISFGTGKITAEFVRDKVCLGLPSNLTEGDGQDAAGQTCLRMNVLTAVEMSTQPFKSFNFDGILGLGLASLALDDEFSFFDVLAKSGAVQSAHFGVFLTDDDDEEQSEIAIGGYNADRFLNPLAWSKVSLPEFGYWQVRILAVRVDGRELDVCKDGTCRGVVDTGTSHLGIPAPHNVEVSGLLAADAGDLLDCRLARTPVLEIELENINLTLGAENYMRRLPLREDVRVGSVKGVDLYANGSKEEHADTLLIDEDKKNVTRNCTPRIMAVNIPEPVGPKLFILGEPVLHRYYTVYDWKGLQVGFSLANKQRHIAEPGSQLADTRGALPNEVDRLLMQQSVVPSFRRHDDDDYVVYLQVDLRLKKSFSRREEV